MRKIVKDISTRKQKRERKKNSLEDEGAIGSSKYHKKISKNKKPIPILSKE